MLHPGYYNDSSSPPPLFSSEDRVRICQEIMSLSELQMQFIVKLIHRMSPQSLKLEKKQWTFDTLNLTNDVLAKIVDYLAQTKALELTSSNANINHEIAQIPLPPTFSEQNDRHKSKNQHKNFSGMSRASFSLSRLSLDLDFDYEKLQKLNSNLGNVSFSRTFSGELDNIFDANDLPRLNDDNASYTYNTRSNSKLKLRKQVSFSEVPEMMPQPEQDFAEDATDQTLPLPNANFATSQPSSKLFEKTASSPKFSGRKRYLDNSCKSMDILTSLIEEPLQISNSVHSSEMQQDLNSMINLVPEQANAMPRLSARKMEMDPNYVFQRPDFKLDLDGRFQTTEQCESDAGSTNSQKAKRRKKNSPRQPVNPKTLSELNLLGFFESYAVSNIPIYKHTDKARIKRLLCFECGKTFRGKSEVVVHVRTHTGERPLQCKYCKKRFAHPSNLKVHERSHRKEKPFKCPVMGCAKEFAHNMSLKDHMKVHENDEDSTDAIFRSESDDVIGNSERDNAGSLSAGSEKGDKKNFTCVHCKEVFAKRVALIKHVKLNHNK